MSPPSPELTYTVLTCGLTSVLWIPIIVNRLQEMGPWKALKNPEPDVRAGAPWAYRLANAHRNATENLVVFAPLAIAVHVLGASTTATAIAAAAFFWSRLAHVTLYTFGVPFLRTVAFVIGFGAQMTLLGRVLGVV